MTGSLSLPPLEFLMRMSPLAALQALACATATGELSAFWALVQSGEVRVFPDFLSLFGNGMLAFLLNISSFQTNKLAGALTMTVCGNLKQCITVALGIFMFDVRIDLLNGLGMAVTMLGAAIYSKSELDNKRNKQRAQPQEQELPIYKPVTPGESSR
jgi:drug/metabolite transporter (DMT)-like permease